MSSKSEKQRIIALQKALKIARETLEKCQFESSGRYIEDALYEINKLDWNSNPDLVMEK